MNQSRGRSTSRVNYMEEPPAACSFCNRKHEKGKYPAYGKIYENCNNINHFGIVSRKSSLNKDNDYNRDWHYRFRQVKDIVGVAKEQADEYLIGEVDIFGGYSWYAHIKDGINMIKSLNNTVLKCSFNDTTELLELIVTSVNSQPVLGLECCIKLNLIKTVGSVEKRMSLEDIVTNMKKLFSILGKISGEYHIK